MFSRKVRLETKEDEMYFKNEGKYVLVQKVLEDN